MAGTNHNKFSFELLCIDPDDIHSEMAMAQALSFSHALWNGNVPKLDNLKGLVSLKEEKSSINIFIKCLDTSMVLTDVFDAGFIINVTSDNLDNIESFRYRILKHLKVTLKFKHIRLLTDEVSTYIANQLYPEINRVETLLRRYLTKFFIQRVGFDWFESTATRAMIEKVKIRNMDRRDILSEFLDEDVRLIDFDDLGELIYKQSSGFNNPEKVMTKLLQIKSEQELIGLQNELSGGNYSKYFKENFQNKNFENKWKELIRLRNKVAHQGTFFMTELTRGLETAYSLADIILGAEKHIDDVIFTIEEKEALRQATIEAYEPVIGNANGNGTDHAFKIIGKLNDHEMEKLIKSHDNAITEDEFLDELDEAENRKYGFYVGLKWFVTTRLADKGYHIPTSYMLVNILCEKGLVEKYDVQVPQGFSVTALRTTK
jgi:hypothetical protein